MGIAMLWCHGFLLCFDCALRITMNRLGSEPSKPDEFAIRRGLLHRRAALEA
jgi:hypothetical protein